MLRKRLTERGLVLPETTITDDVEDEKNEVQSAEKRVSLPPMAEHKN